MYNYVNKIKIEIIKTQIVNITRQLKNERKCKIYNTIKRYTTRMYTKYINEKSKQNTKINNNIRQQNIEYIF